MKMNGFAQMAAEYRRSAAAISLRIEAMGEPFTMEERRRKSHLIAILAELRTTAAMLEHYYDAPREAGFSAQGYYAPKGERRDD